ncbi:MAG: hypothetical protein HGA96_14290 [Desulfobulbaceae bacterium]|nr:hypothetical protein [Desulfobulbaceae bacterium]
MFKTIRIASLLLILVLVALTTWLTKLRTTSWQVPLLAVVYPVNADGSEVAARYIAGLTAEDFHPVADFLAQEGHRHGLTLANPLRVELADQVSSLPPEAPVGGSIPAIMLWSLRLRWWAWRVDNFQGPGDIKLFLLYHDPAERRQLNHSLGLQKGLLGVVKAFADRRDAPGNNVVIAHELLHTLGATDKYDLASGLPTYPDGFAEPERQPLYPQERAEIMGAVVPVAAGQIAMPAGLGQVVVGPATAKEIGWGKKG